ncbi:hypothetical protein KI387_017045 [Taxus chinensis]|uniref:Protein kinase domain-containing protein n=1 Tax=Taxus chinensis TaxID=29808 RepID=A0AA38GFM6_TAXCH|nr:hypothetical protein KI387_017045 [Taxus chinensis]
MGIVTGVMKKSQAWERVGNNSSVVRSRMKDDDDENDDEHAGMGNNNNKCGCWHYLMPNCIATRSSSSVVITTTVESRSLDKICKEPPIPQVVSPISSSDNESNPSTPKGGDLKLASQLLKFSFNELKAATRNFRPESILGEGGFGCVFKGWIEENGTGPVKPGTGLTVAVKTLNHDGLQGHKEWVIVQYWLPIHVTQGDCLTQEYNAKLSDFGLAKDGPEGDNTHVSTRVMGTYGYAAPEYVMTGHLSSKSDVYSFGVVLLEMLTGRRSMDKNRPSGEHNLVAWARPYLTEKRKLYRLMDPRLEFHYSVKGAQKAAQIAHHCLSRDPKARPLMDDVVEALTPLLNLKDMASSSLHHQVVQSVRSGRHPHMENGNGQLSSKNGIPRTSIRDACMSPCQHSPRHNGK